MGARVFATAPLFTTTLIADLQSHRDSLSRPRPGPDRSPDPESPRKLRARGAEKRQRSADIERMFRRALSRRQARAVAQPIAATIPCIAPDRAHLTVQEDGP